MTEFENGDKVTVSTEFTVIEEWPADEVIDADEDIVELSTGPTAFTVPKSDVEEADDAE